MIDLFIDQRGGILADEMGLGKTLQVLTFVIGLINSGKGNRFLVLCPSTVINQWTIEFKGLIDKLNWIHDPKHLIIKSYEKFRIDANCLDVDGVFLDEGHRIKNKDSLISISVKTILTPNRFVITGTPIQNSLSELWSIFNFINPNMLGSYSTFQDEFENKIKNPKSDKEKRIAYEYSVLLRSTIDPYIKRRLKSQINHKLPNKTDKIIFLGLSPEQTNLYIKTLESKRFKDLRDNINGSKHGVLSAICLLRKICNHPILVQNEKPDFMKTYDNECTKNIENVLSTITDPLSLISSSSKLKAVVDLLQKWFEDKHKVLLFFQTVQMLKIVEFLISQAFNKFKFLTMSGKTPLLQRSKLVDRFNNDKDIFLFLLTTRVGGLGLNLTGASRIIIFDPDWNPSTDNQAKERIYRFGQKSNIEIYALICKSTIEEKIYEKQIYKDNLSKRILSNQEIAFSKHYFSDIFSFYPESQQEIEIDIANGLGAQTSGLVEIKQEDVNNYRIIKDLGLKRLLSGRELIEYINRRESSLSEYNE